MSAARGQATVELALGATLLVTIIMLGLYLTEVSFLSLKVQEASNAALWDATGRPAHDFRNPNSGTATGNPYDGILTATPGAIERRYRDFDAWRNAPAGTRRLFAQAGGLDVSCEQAPATGGGAIAYNVPPVTQRSDGQLVPGATNAQLREWYRPRGGTVCTSSATVAAFDLPTQFLDDADDGFFAARFRGEQPIRLCGAGRAVSGSCSAGYGILLGDWGLDGPPTSRIVRDSVLPESPNVNVNNGNVPYRQMVRELFEVTGRRYYAGRVTGGSASRFAARVGDTAGRTPHNERRFYMSYAGSEHNYVDMLEPEEVIPARCRTCHYNTNGSFTVTGNPLFNPNARKIEDDDRDRNWHWLRRRCFLGLGGCNLPN